jgi:hypothetical protein
MPVVSMFYGIIVSMYYQDNKRRHRPHIHVAYQDDEAILSIPEATILEGNFPKGRLTILRAWVEIHQDELLANWELAKKGQQIYRIPPLK